MLRRLFGRQPDQGLSPGQAMQLALLDTKEAIWTHDLPTFERAYAVLLDLSAKTEGGDRIANALTALDANVLRERGMLPDDVAAGLLVTGPEAMTYLELEVARFAARGDAHEMTRYLIQGLCRLAAYRLRRGDLDGAFEIFKQVQESASGLPESHPLRLAADAFMSPESVGEARKRALENLWGLVFEVP